MIKESKFILFWVVSMVFLLIIGCSSPQETFKDLPEKVDFNYDIRPILSQNCYLCHGPDSSSRKANLRLDIFAGATAKLSSGKKAIVPGSSSKSEILKRLHSDDPKFVMPPPESKKTVTPRQRALIEKWIDQGAKWKPHWALIPPTSKFINDKQSIHETIDQLIKKSLGQKNLVASGRANKNALIRRVSYLVTGLPPSSQDVLDFVSDESTDAYENMVYRYLNSPQYGERWARHWMDLVRYAEHMGHEFDFGIGGAWHYRDYLIRAFNDDVPYDRFVKEHLAGDLLEEPRINPKNGNNESVLGTAYVFLGEGKHSPVDIKQEEADRMDNIIDVTSKTFQGLTVACAKCHDHKFDPIPTTDYYAMYGMFESSRIGPRKVNRSPIDQQKLVDLKQLNLQITKSVQTQLEEEIQNISEAEIEALKLYWSDSIDHESIMGEILADFRDGIPKGWICTGETFQSAKDINIPLFKDDKIKRVDSEIITSRRIIHGQMGALRSPNFAIQDSFLVVKAAGQNGTIRIIVENFQLIQNPLYGSLQRTINNFDWKEYKFDLRLVQGRKAYIEIMPGSHHQHQFKILPNDFIDVQYIARLNQLPNHAKSDSSRLDASPEFPDLNAKNNQFTNAYINFKDGIPINDHIKNLLDQKDKLALELFDDQYFMGLNEGPEVYSPVFVRGSIKQPSSEEVAHQFLSAVSDKSNVFNQKGSGRLQWAESVADHSNPLTSRVMVNRIWHHLFGKGIVKSVDNFGLQGDLPTHPELLDYLSLKFMENGWSIKSIIKEILLSDTFQSVTTKLAENDEIDPGNNYYHHFPIRRLEAEAIRDGLLASTESINLEMYGPPVPIHLTEFMNGRGRPAESGPLDGNGRRSIYISVRRNFLSPMMLTFDMPIPFSTFGKRNNTNVPAQSLTLMNDPFVHDQAMKWAERLIRDYPQNLEERLNTIYIQAFSRPISDKEIEVAKSLINSLTKTLDASNEEMMVNQKLWQSYCHTIFNAKEFIHLM